MQPDYRAHLTAFRSNKNNEPITTTGDWHLALKTDAAWSLCALKKNPG